MTLDPIARLLAIDPRELARWAVWCGLLVAAWLAGVWWSLADD